MDRLWAPWRTDYITQAVKPSGCFLCAAALPGEDEERLVVVRTKLSVVLLNRYPYNNGHLLISPRAHKAELTDLSTAESADLQHLLTKLTAIVKAGMNADGFNVGLNLGRAAGAGVPGHLHWHLVPRWNGDQNFMPVTGETKIMSQSLKACRDLLHARCVHLSDKSETTFDSL